MRNPHRDGENLGINMMMEKISFYGAVEDEEKGTQKKVAESS